MPWWGTVILSVSVALIAGLSGLGAAVWSVNAATKQARSNAAEARAARGGEVLAPILLFLDDIEPVRLSYKKSSATPRHVLQLHARWEELRHPLAAWAASHPSQAVFDKSPKVIQAVWDSFTSTAYAVDALIEGMIPLGRDDVQPGPRAKDEIARLYHHDARQAADELLALVRAVDKANWRASLG